MNIKDIKERVGLRAHMKTLCNNPNMLTNWVGSINYNNAEDDVIYLLSLIEHQDNSFKRLQSKAYVGSHDAMLHEINVEIEALQAIKGDK